MRLVAKVTKENGLWWAAYRRNGLRLKLPFRKKLAALYWLGKHGFKVSYGAVVQHGQTEFQRRST